jgi:hypothetical protein
MQVAQAMPSMGAPDIPVNAAPIHWTLPAGWEEKPPDSIRLASFAITGEKGGKASVAITSFPGSVGTELDNVNRWRGELGLAPVGPAEVAPEAVTVDSLAGKLYDLAGKSARTVVAVIPRNGNSWFIKMRGDTDTVAAGRPAFLAFLKSLHFGGDGGETPAAADPHAGLGLPGVSSPHVGSVEPATAPEAPQWNVPAKWVETAPRAMVFKSFSVADDAGAKAEITVSFFPGDVGGTLANVNRWRGQMGQKPVEQSQLNGVTESLAAVEGKATLVDFMGVNGKSGQPARLVGAIVPRGDHTWFYKMTGDGKVVAGQKDNFVQFVKTVHYP